jgi:hypothetical protein
MSSNDKREMHDEQKRYELTVYVAAPGTPVIDSSTGESSRSIPGHMYYRISDEQSEIGYGFAPKWHGVPIAPGAVSIQDFKVYQDPVYARTMEITREQYDKLKDFGEAAVANKQTHFNLTYNGATNSCIDFTWAALNHAGLHQQLALPQGQSAPVRDADGQLLPGSNISVLQSIQAPFPDSPYNRVETNPPPPGLAEKANQAKDNAQEKVQDTVKEGLQKVLCDAYSKLPFCPPGVSQRALPDPFDPRDPDFRLREQIETGVRRIDAVAGREYDDGSRNLMLTALVQAKEQGIGRADHVALSVQGKDTDNYPGKYLFVLEGTDAYDARNRVARVATLDGMSQPAEHSLGRLDELRLQQTQTYAQEATLRQDGPKQEGPKIGALTM